MKKKKNCLQIISQIITEILTGIAIGITVSLTICIIFMLIYGGATPEKASGTMDLRREDGSLPTTQEELPEGIDGYYSPDKGLIVCFNPWTCLHEIGHKVDDEKREGLNDGIYFSKTKEWEAIVDYYRTELFISTGDPDQIEDRINDFPGIGDNSCDTTWDRCYGGYVELYACILEYSHGNPENMPEIFREFYDWERIWELEKEYPEIEEWKLVN